jgi:hypothetical protein
MLRNNWLIVCCAFALLVASPVLAQGNPQLADLNAEALEAYQNLDIDTAKAKLEQGIALAGQTNYVGPELTQLYMTLGVVHVAGASDHDQGLAAFTSALCMQSDAQLDPLLSTPDVQQVFIQAQSEAQASGCAGGGGGTGVVPPPSQVGFAPSSGGPQVEDVECPPGVVCGAEDDGVKDTEDEFARWFVNVQFAMGFGFVQPGMPTDSKPDASEIFLDGPADSFGIRNNKDGLPGHQQAVAFDMNGNPTLWEDRFLFDDTSGWVPDADSFDDYEEYDGNMLIIPRATTPVSSQCEADGTETGPAAVQGRSFSLPPESLPPLGMARPPEPSTYCVRVAASGFVPGLALRLTPGYFITEGFAISLPLRFQLDSSGGPFGKIQLGLRGEVLFSEMDSATGFPVSWFFGASYGKIEVKPPPKDPSREVPWVVGGPLGLNTGINVRYRIHRNFGLVASPEVGVYLPDLLLNLEISIGAEAAF